MPTLHQIQSLSADVRTAVEEFCAGLKTIYGGKLDRVILFGSRARGDARFDSDVDLLVVLRGDVEPGREIRLTSQLTHEVSLRHGCVLLSLFVSSEDLQDRRTPLLDSVRREGVPL
jgi:uncharacterized protein